MEGYIVEDRQGSKSPGPLSTADKISSKGFQQIAKTSVDSLDPLSFFTRTSFDDKKPLPAKPNKLGGTLTSQSFDSINVTNEEVEFRLVTGEKQLMNLKDAFVQLNVDRVLSGTLVMTNYRVSFVPSSSSSAEIRQNPSIMSWFNIPLSAIEKIDKETTRSLDAKVVAAALVLTCKDIRQVRITVQAKQNLEGDIERAYNVLVHYAFTKKTELLFAFSHSLTPLSPERLFPEPYSAILEFARQGVTTEEEKPLFRISYANSHYRLCST